MIPCLCTLYFNSNIIFCAHTLGSFLILFRAPFLSYHNIIIQSVLWIIWLLSSFVEVYPLCYLILFAILILNIVWFPSNICLCICACVFTYFFWISTSFWRNSHYIGLLSFFAHFVNGCQWGRSFEGLKGIGFYALVLCLSICLACFASLCVVLHGWVYSRNSTNNLGWQYMQWNQDHLHMHRLWGSLLYIWWFY
jgi:hypothetical protein